MCLLIYFCIQMFDQVLPPNGATPARTSRATPSQTHPSQGQPPLSAGTTMNTTGTPLPSGTPQPTSNATPSSVSRVYRTPSRRIRRRGAYRLASSPPEEATNSTIEEVGVEDEDEDDDDIEEEDIESMDLGTEELSFDESSSSWFHAS